MPSPFVRVIGVCACVLVVALCLIVIGLASLSVCGRLFCWSALCLSWSLGVSACLLWALRLIVIWIGDMLIAIKYCVIGLCVLCWVDVGWCACVLCVVRDVGHFCVCLTYASVLGLSVISDACYRGSHVCGVPGCAAAWAWCM